MNFITALGKFSHAPGLSFMRALSRALGEPEKGRAFVHVAGTNGKGSTSAMIAAISRAAGLKTGLYTSPDLTDIRERIGVNEVNITKEDFARLTTPIARVADTVSGLSYFEALTALGFLYFAEQSCGLTVLECGLGGRYDATNIIETPRCSVIMPIGLDHTAVLGDTLPKISAEKAGIIKPGGAVVCAPQRSEALPVIEAACRTQGASLQMVDINKIRSVETSSDGQVFSYKEYKNLHISLLGAYQLQNACAAVEAAQVLNLTERAVREGLVAARWPCRFELARKAPPFILDGAHNPQAALSLADGLCAIFPGQRFVFLMGIMADKDYDAVLRVMEPLAERFVCFTPDSPRALPAGELAAHVRGVPAMAAQSLEEAVSICLNSEKPVCAFGSLYYIGYVRKLLQ